MHKGPVLVIRLWCDWLDNPKLFLFNETSHDADSQTSCLVLAPRPYFRLELRKEGIVTGIFLTGNAFVMLLVLVYMRFAPLPANDSLKKHIHNINIERKSSIPQFPFVYQVTSILDTSSPRFL